MHSLMVLVSILILISIGTSIKEPLGASVSSTAIVSPVYFKSKIRTTKSHNLKKHPKTFTRMPSYSDNSASTSCFLCILHSNAWFTAGQGTENETTAVSNKNIKTPILSSRPSTPRLSDPDTEFKPLTLKSTGRSTRHKRADLTKSTYSLNVGSMNDKNLTPVPGVQDINPHQNIGGVPTYNVSTLVNNKTDSVPSQHGLNEDNIGNETGSILEDRSGLCRDRQHYLEPRNFRVASCSMCLVYLFPSTHGFGLAMLNKTTFLLKVVQTQPSTPPQQDKSPLSMDNARNPISQDGTLTTQKNQGTSKADREENVSSPPSVRISKIFPDIENISSTEEVCAALTASQCERWLTCCKSAQACCHRQLTRPATDQGLLGQRNGTHCPMTWDGYSCVDATPAGQVAEIVCPAFITDIYLDSEARATRTCLDSGQWWMDPQRRLEWTDYSSCLSHNVDSLKAEQFVSIACNAISMVLLTPAMAVFLCIRSLRMQQRIRLHICLFVTLFLSSLLDVLWSRLVNLDILASPHSNFARSSPNTCKALNIISRFTRTSSFFWMFCEGFELHWLMVKAFKPIGSIIPFLLVGWGIPIILAIIYVVIRVTQSNDSMCWLTSAGHLEWVVDGPTVACITANVIFLISILRALITQLKSHGDGSHFRRALRAMGILVPLLGLQQFCILYRPSSSRSGYMVYAIFSAVVIGTQGALVSLIFCFFNTEVRGQLFESVRKLRLRATSPSNRRQSTTSMTLTWLGPRRSLASLNVDSRRPSNSCIGSVQSVNGGAHNAMKDSQSQPTRGISSPVQRLEEDGDLGTTV